jgi:predicted phosphodiesterase
MKYVYIYVNTIKIRFMKSILAFSMMAILLLLFTVFGHTSSVQMVDAQTNSITAALSDFNFAAAGDWGCKDETTETVNNIVDKTPEVVLGLGDFSYSDDANCWLEIIEPIDDNMKIAIGNEDLQGSELTQLMEHFGLTSQYYSFDYQNVHFTVMADHLPYETDSEQYDFVNDDLAKAATDPNIDWIIIVHHSQKYASTQNYDIPEEKEWNNIYHPLLEQYNVDLVLQGHQHNYQRTYPIKYNSDTPINPIITDKSTNNYNNPEGQIFLTVGTGGIDLHDLDGNKAPYITITEYEEFGFLNVDVMNSNANNNNERTSTLVGTFYSNNGGGSEKIMDQFTITKSATAEDSSPIPSPPDLTLQETDEFDEGGIAGFDDAPVSEQSGDVDDVDASAEDGEEEE